jgi:hydrogenase/urease accessory protein HupE
MSSTAAAARSGGRVRWSAVACSATAVLLLPAPAHAHLVTTGLGPLYDGIGHVLVSPDDLLPVLAMAFLAGLNGRAAGRAALFLLPLAWAVGGLAGFVARAPLVPGAAATTSFLLLGFLTAVDRRLSAALVASLAVALGLLHGWLNGAGIATAGREALGLAGIVAAVFVLVAISAAFVVSLRAPWARIVVRVAGSWIAAIGLLMLGWSLRGAV